MRVGIVGNGISGLMSAIHLVHDYPGVEIVLVGESERRHSGTMAAAVMLNSLAEVDEQVTEDKPSWTKLRHSREADILWDSVGEILSALDESVEFKPHRGTVILQTGESGSLEHRTFNSIINVANKLDEAVQPIELTDIAGYQPTYQGRAGQSVILPREGFLDPESLIPKIDSVLKSQSTFTYLPGTCAEIIEQQFGIEVILESGEKFDCDKVILCNGYGAKHFLSPLGFVPGVHNSIYAGEGTTMRLLPTTMSQSMVIRTPNRGLACGLYSAPHNTSLVIGATNHVTEEPSGYPTAESLRSLTGMATRELNKDLSSAGVLKINHGIRPVTSDGFPLVGPVSERIFMIAGTRRDGWHFAPLWSRVAAKAAVDGAFDQKKWALYDPWRQPIFDNTIEESVALGVENYISGMTQHGYVEPGGHYPRHIEENYARYFRELHQYFGLDHGLPPDLLGVASTRRQSGSLDARF